jgi:alkaline phosphatase
MKLQLAVLALVAAPLLAAAQDPHEPFDPHEMTEDVLSTSKNRMLTLNQRLTASFVPRSLKTFEPSLKQYKNVIMMVPDGCDETVQTMAHLYKGSDLQVDQMPSTGVTSHMANSMITGSAAAATAFSTGQKTTVRFLSVGPRTEDLLTIFDPQDMATPYAPVATILEAAKYLGKGTGLVSTSRVSHATPAAFACHIDDRGKDNDIMEHIVYNNINVVMGGGKRHLLPGDDCPNAVSGGKRTDCQDLEQVLKDRGYTMLETKNDLENLQGTEDKVYGMFAMSHMQPDIDRKHFAQDEPSIAEMTQASIDILSKNEGGFFLMVEGSQVDWAGHNNDVSCFRNNFMEQDFGSAFPLLTQRHILFLYFLLQYKQPVYMMTDFVAFDDAVKVAVDFAKTDGDTLVLVFPDHNTGGPKIGNYGKSYTDVSLERLREPFLGMTMSANGVTTFIPAVNATNADVMGAVKDHWNLEITEQDVADIYDYKNVSGNSLSYSLAKLLSERYTEIGWTTHGHNGETGRCKDSIQFMCLDI